MFLKYEELKKRVFFSILMILVYRLGSYIPIAGIDSFVLHEVSKHNSSGLLGLFNVLSGGSLGRMSIFALAIMPYITSSIVIQLFSIAYPPLENLKKEGELGRKKMAQISRYLTVFLASFQAYGIAIGLEGMTFGGAHVVIMQGILFRFVTVITLVVGTMLLMWIGEQITSSGIGNGSSLIIFFGIVSGLPSGIISIFELVRKGGMNPILGFAILLLVLSLVAIVIFFERAIRKVTIQYPKHRGMRGESFASDSSYIPLKVNTSGVIPPMFASSVLLFPLTIVNFVGADSYIGEWISFNLSHGRPLFIVCYIALIIFFSFFYTAVVFNSEEIANNLRKGSAIIPSKKPGKSTAEYFDYILSHITIIGAIYLCCICIIPEIFMNYMSVSFYLGGTSILIVVNVVIETFNQMQSYTMGNRYESIAKKIKIR